MDPSGIQLLAKPASKRSTSERPHDGFGDHGIPEGMQGHGPALVQGGQTAGCEDRQGVPRAPQ